MTSETIVISDEVAFCYSYEPERNGFYSYHNFGPKTAAGFDFSLSVSSFFVAPPLHALQCKIWSKLDN